MILRWIIEGQVVREDQRFPVVGFSTGGAETSGYPNRRQVIDIDFRLCSVFSFAKLKAVMKYNPHYNLHDQILVSTSCC